MTYPVLIALPLALLILASAVPAQQLDDSLEVVSGTNQSATRSQQTIDELARETRLLLDEYRNLRDGASYQQDFSRELAQLEAAQDAEIASLSQQIAEARITRQRILPLMRSMADALEQFVVLDLPFHQQQRIDAVLQLQQRIDRPDLSVAARFRLLLETYQLEQDYNHTVEAWRGPLQLADEQLSVEFLRLGRTALYFQTLDRKRCGYWDRETRSWQPLDEAQNRALAQAMRVARGEMAPQLLELPLLAEVAP